MIFISGPITDTIDYEERFKKAETYLKEQEHIVINPVAIAKALPCYPCLDYELYMGIDLFLLSKCKEIYMLKGWQDSRGANQELKYAIENNYKIYVEV